MKVQWGKITWYSKIITFILFITLPFIGFWLGIRYESELRSNNFIQHKPAIVRSPAYVIYDAEGEIVKNKRQNKPTKNIVEDFHLLSPNGGKSFCLNDTMFIEWKVSPDIQTVTLRLRETETDITYTKPIGTYPSSYNETGEKNGKGRIPWIITQVPEGEVYKIWLSAVYNNRLLLDSSENVFAIRRCEG